jgi:GNAT superfamily N-acetyltransferase
LRASVTKGDAEAAMGLEDKSEISVVPYSKNYCEAFRDLNLEWIKNYFEVEQADRDALDDPEGYILARGGFIFIALLNDQPIGVCALIPRDDQQFPLELAKMAVSPLAQGKGVGTLLGNAIIEKARELNAKNLFLESNTILKPAIRLYKKLGFKEITGYPTPYQRCNIQMELKL